MAPKTHWKMHVQCYLLGDFNVNLIDWLCLSLSNSKFFYSNPYLYISITDWRQLELHQQLHILKQVAVTDYDGILCSGIYDISMGVSFRQMKKPTQVKTDTWNIVQSLSLHSFCMKGTLISRNCYNSAYEVLWQQTKDIHSEMFPKIKLYADFTLGKL